jgi:two-component system, OmpR family, sensor histidine kinase KdpD
VDGKNICGGYVERREYLSVVYGGRHSFCLTNRGMERTTFRAGLSVAPRKWARRASAAARLYPIPAAVGLVAATTGALIVLHGVLPIDHVTLVYLVPVMLCAVQWGLMPALAATIAAVTAADFFFYPPLYTFNVDDPRDIIDLILFSCVAVVTSELAARLRRAADAAISRESEVRDLYAFSRRLAGCTQPADIYAAIGDYLSSTLRTRAIHIANAETLTRQRDEPLGLPNAIGAAATELFASSSLEARMVAEPRSRHTWVVRSVSSETFDFGLIAVDLGLETRGCVDAIKRRIDGILADAATTLARLDVARLIDQAGQRAQTDLLRKALLGAVSHDLRTPLASIVGASTILVDAPSLRQDPRLRALLEVLHEEAGRLNDDIQNLLDAVRITNDDVRARAEWVDLTDVVNAAIERRRARFVGRPIEVNLAANLPLVKVEARLIEQALGHILENAAKYSPPGSTIAVRAVAEAERLMLSVRDEGIGLTREEIEHVWERSFRGARHPDVGGTGLGLWIARAFVVANGGTVVAESAGPRRGTTISIGLPVMAYSVEEAEEGCDA